MSDLPLKKDAVNYQSQSASGPYGVAGDSPGNSGAALIFPRETGKFPTTTPPPKLSVKAIGAGRLVTGLVFMFLAMIVALYPQSRWESLVEIIHPIAQHQVARYGAAGLFALLGLLFGRVPPLNWLASAALFFLATIAVDRLTGDRLVQSLEENFGQHFPAWQFLIGTTLLLAYLVHSGRPAERLRPFSIIGFVIVALTALGTVQGWFPWEKIASYFGTAVEEFSKTRRDEVLWLGIVAILLALGLSLSRTRLTQFLCAIVLLALTYHCINSGYIAKREFPGLSAVAGRTIEIEESSYKNVQLYQWVFGGTLVFLAAIYLHMSLGIGALCVSFAVAWLLCGLALSNSIGTMSVVRYGNDLSGGKPGTSLFGNMGLPTTNTLPRSRPDSSLAPNLQKEIKEQIEFEAGVREVTQFGWIVFSAIFAGIVAATGFRLMFSDPGHRYWVGLLLMLAFGGCAVVLYWVWPKDPNQSWQQWLVAFKMSRYYPHAVAVTSLGAMALAAGFSLKPSSLAHSWIDLSIACIFCGTMFTLLAAAILIRFGNFPKLPAWIYLVITIAQSSLAWALLMYRNFSARAPRPPIKI